MRILALAVLLSVLASSMPSAFAQNKSDDRIYDQVRLKLANNPDVKGGAIEVTVTDGVVKLNGKVRTDRAKHKAEQLTGKIKGVKKVINELQVSPS